MGTKIRPVDDRTVLEVFGPSTGGIRRHIAALAEGVRANGWEAKTAGPAGVLDGLAPLDYAVAVGRPGRDLLQVVSVLSGAIEDSGAAIVHAHGMTAAYFALMARAGRPIIVTLHNVLLEMDRGPGGWLMRRLEAALPGRVDAAIAATEEVRGRFRGPAGEAIKLIPPVGTRPHAKRDPAQVRAELGLPPTGPLVVSVARLHPQKDLPTLLRAAGRLKDELPDLRVVLVGEGPERAALEKMIERMDLDGRVLLAGATDDPAGVMASADVVVVTSVWEGIPFTSAEALELGRPLLTTPAGLVGQLLEQSSSASIFAVGDDAGLAQRICELLGDPSLARARAAQDAKAYSALLGRERLIEQVTDLYEEVLGG